MDGPICMSPVRQARPEKKQVETKTTQLEPSMSFPSSSFFHVGGGPLGARGGVVPGVWVAWDPAGERQGASSSTQPVRHRTRSLEACRVARRMLSWLSALAPFFPYMKATLRGDVRILGGRVDGKIDEGRGGRYATQQHAHCIMHGWHGVAPLPSLLAFFTLCGCGSEGRLQNSVSWRAGWRLRAADTA